MSIMPETVFAKKFSKAFIAGERSDYAIQKALIVGLIDFVKSDFNTTGIAWAVRFMHARNPESARFHAIVKWLEDVCSLRVILNDDSNKCNVKTVKKTSYDTAWLAGCKDTPWYKVARSMQVAKPWADPLESMKRKYAEGFLMGDVTESMLQEVFGPRIVAEILALKGDDKLQARVAQRMSKLDEQGDLVALAA